MKKVLTNITEIGHGNIPTTILELADGIRQAYWPSQPTDTLITKIVLGTFACHPHVIGTLSTGLSTKGFSTRP